MSSHLAGMREDRAPSWSAFAARRASGSCPLVGCRRRRERQRPEDCRAATRQLRSFGGSGRLLARRARTRWPPWEVVLTPGPFAAGFANGIPALDNPTLVCRRRIPPIRLLSFGELAFGDLNQLVIGLHDRIVRMRHFEAAMTLGTERAHVKPGFRQESHRGVDAMMGHQTASASVHRPAHRGQNTCSSRRALMSCSCLDRSPNTTLGPGPHRGQPRVRMQRVSHPAAAPADTGAENRLRRNRIFSWRPDRLGDGLGLDWRRVLRGQRLVGRIGEHRWLRLFLGRRIVGHNPRLRPTGISCGGGSPGLLGGVIGAGVPRKASMPGPYPLTAIANFMDIGGRAPDSHRDSPVAADGRASPRRRRSRRRRLRPHAGSIARSAPSRAARFPRRRFSLSLSCRRSPS